MSTPLLPAALQVGDVIGIVSPSWFGGEGLIPRAKRGAAMLDSLGFRVTVARHAFNTLGHVSDTPEHRADDLHAMFADDSIAGIICTIGGDHSNEVLSLLDWDLIRTNPKPFMGFSDMTVLLNAIHSLTGLVTFHGPALLTDWAEFPSMPDISRESAMRLLTDPVPFGALPQVEEWTEEFLDWETGEDVTRRRVHRPSTGWTWIRHGQATGPLIGGCLESLQHLRGTTFWPDFDGAILFIETSEASRGPEDAASYLTDFANMGVFDDIAGLLIGRPYGYDDDAHKRFVELVAEKVDRFDFPVVTGLDIGHTSPQLTLPIGVPARIDGDRMTVEITGSAVVPRGPDSDTDLNRLA